MTPGKQQLAFDLPSRQAFARADYFASGANAMALAAIDGWQGWPQRRMLLIGPAGSGKTHLAHIWAAATAAQVIAAADLAQADLPALAVTRAGGGGGAVVVEDAERLPPAAADRLFHLHNLMQQQAGYLLITAASPPRDWPATSLPDLASRMQAMAATRLDAPDDSLLTAVLVKLFADRQITVPANLISYLTRRMDRSLHAARELVAALDACALAQGRPVTRALAAEVLGAEMLDNDADA